ncbi:hypothetical protein E4U16_007217 [Claviceps sp. LM84 group G4]|nr:hypothetical protein E4U16_007217 [Claviceps sp. LM84 group G4]
MGLPCKHKISQRLADNLILKLEDIDPHWYFDRKINPGDLIVDRPMPILEPLITVTRRGRPQGSTATISASQAPTDGNDTPRGRVISKLHVAQNHTWNAPATGGNPLS